MTTEPPPAFLRLTSWNILADAYASQRLYPTIDPEILRWNRRAPAIVARAVALQPDILCLQEVQASHWPDLQQSFARHGWQGAFAQKRQSRPDGCALLYRTPSVTLLTTETLYFEDGESGAAPSGHLALIGSFRTALGLLRVATTHFRWQAPTPNSEAHIGYRQAVQLLHHLGNQAPALRGTIVCGDFNVPPASPLAQLFPQHGFVDACASSPLPTCNPNHRASRIDFLFATQPLNPTPEPIPHLENDTPLPSASEPSDHLPITAVIRPASIRS